MTSIRFAGMLLLTFVAIGGCSSDDGGGDDGTKPDTGCPAADVMSIATPPEFPDFEAQVPEDNPTTIQGVAPLRMRAFAAAISILISTLIGLAAGPLLVGVLADGFEARFGEDALRYSLLVPTCAPLLSSLVCFFGARRVAGDLDRAKSADEASGGLRFG